MAVKTIDTDLIIQGYIQPTTIELGNATDTTLSRVSAGKIAVEGNEIYSNQSNQFAGLTEKTTLVNDDLIVIEDSAASGAKKKVKSSTLIAVPLTINSQSGTSYTLVLADASNTLIRINNAAAITLTVPTNASVAIPIGSVISVEQQGAGIITVTPAGGVTINTTARKSWGQNAVIQLIKLGTDVWNVINATV